MSTFSRLVMAGLAAGLYCFAASSSGQTISIVSGNGQIICPTCPAETTGFFFKPSVVAVTDSSGNPVVGASVTWKAVYEPQDSAPITVTATTATGSNGQTSYVVPDSYPMGFSSFAQSTLTATAGGSSVQFVETYAFPTDFGGLLPVQVTQVSPSVLTALTGSTGQVGSTPIQVAVTTPLGPVPYVQVSLGPAFGTTWTEGTLACMTQPGQQPGTVLTNSMGMATCYPVFAGKPGTAQYGANAGDGFAQASPHSFTVTLAEAVAIKIVAGNNQAVNPGNTAPLSLVAEVVDSAGNPSANANVTWTVTPAGAATLSQTTTVSAANGYVLTRFTGVTSGPVQVQVTDPTTSATATFNLTVNSVTTTTGLQIVSGNNQSAAMGAAFTDPLIVQVNDGDQPLPNATVSFAVTSGSATLSAATAATNAQGQAQVTATAGPTTGPVVVTASATGSSQTYSQTFDLTVSGGGPSFTAAGVTNAASFQSQFIAPCSLATIFGTGLTNGLQGVLEFFLAPQMNLNGVTVQFGNASAPILDLVNLNGQESITVQVPCEVGPGTVPVTVTVAGVPATVPVKVSQYSPGIFQTTMSDGVLRAVLVRQDGSYVSLENPVQPGDILRMYVTGLGQTNPPIVTGETVPLILDSSTNTFIPENLAVLIEIAIGVNNGGVHVLSAQYAYGMIGVYEIVFQVPENAKLGNNDPFAILLYSGLVGVYGNPSLIPIQ